MTKAINGSEVNITELVSPKVVNMEIEINNLVDIHKLSFDIQKKLYRLLTCPPKTSPDFKLVRKIVN